MAVNFYENGKTPEAIRSLALVLANDPKHAEANHLMGFIRLGRGQYEEAVRHFQTALETNPDMLTCRNNLGAAYMHLERGCSRHFQGTRQVPPLHFPMACICQSWLGLLSDGHDPGSH